MLLLASLLLTTLPQGAVHGRGSTLVLPPPRTAAPVQDPVAERDGLQERFHKDALSLRRSLYLSESEELARIQRIGDTYDRVAERALLLVRQSDADLAHGLMRVLRTYGDATAADDLRFLLLTRPFGDATGIVVETMTSLGGDRANPLLFECLTASRPAVRKHAADTLATRVGAADVDHLVTLSRQERTDVQVKALRLLGAVRDSHAARDRLVQGLGQHPVLAEAACRGLIDHGVDAVPALQAILRRPAVGRSFGYAAVALAAIEEKAAPDAGSLFGDDMREHLIEELDMPDPFQRAAVAIGLAGMAFRSADTSGEPYADRAVIDALVRVVAPTEYVAHLALLQEVGARRLTQLSGKDFGVQHALWRAWWDELKGVERLVGSRQRVAIDTPRADVAVLDWRGRPTRMRFAGVGASALRPDADALDFLLAPDEMLALVADLEALGFMRPAARNSGEPDGRQLVLNVGGAVTHSDPWLRAATLERFAKRIEREAHEQRWQLYRDARAEPDVAAFWRSERRWREQHPSDAERAGRLKSRILAVLGGLSPRRFDVALEHLTGLPDLRTMLTEADAAALIAAADARAEWSEREFRVLELALAAPGESWRELLAVAERRLDTAAGRTLLARVFALLGPDRILESLEPGTSASIRLAAMDEIARLRDVRALEPLIAALGEADTGIRRSAVYTLGKLGLVDAEQPLLELLRQDGLDPELRRTAWIALARIGGDSAIAVLQQAFPSADPADRSAVVQALGALARPAAAVELANIYALRGDDTLGLLALEHLRMHGDLTASPALHAHVEHPNLEVRRQVLLLLGSFQDPVALPALIDMLAEDRERARIVALIAGTTGQDVTARNDRVEFLRGWLVGNRHLSQAEWLLRALAESGVKTTLSPAQFGPGTGTAVVPELCRLVVEAEPPYLRALAARVLRVVTQRDFGVIGPLTTEDQRRAIAERYSALHDADKAAAGR